MIVLSEAASNAMLDVLGVMMDGGSIKLLTSDGNALAVLKLSNPATRNAIAGELVFNKIAEEDAAGGQGHAVGASVVAADGSEVFSCDVGVEKSDAVIKLRGTTMIYPGQPIELDSFRLVMPNGG
jgi:hypothetical protein